MRSSEDPLAAEELAEENATEFWWEEESLALLNHDLRNALSSIVSALHILRHEGYVSPLAEQAGRTIERQAEHLSLLADQLSEVAGVSKERTSIPEPRRPSTSDRLEETRPRRVLVVDDNRDAADSTGTLLLLWGHQVKVAYDGESALAVAREYRPDVCLLDLGMPGMNGYQVAQCLRQESGLRGIQLVAMTGFDQEADRQLSRDAGFDSYLVKPVELAALQEVLTRNGRV
jgi:CheY-like chemotaxis protein